MFEKKLSKGRLNRIAVLVPCEDGKPETIGSAFKITASVSDAQASAAPFWEGSASALAWPSEMLLDASRGCQVDDLKKAPRLKGLKPNFSHPVLELFAEGR